MSTLVRGLMKTSALYSKRKTSIHTAQAVASTAVASTNDILISKKQPTENTIIKRFAKNSKHSRLAMLNFVWSHTFLMRKMVQKRIGRF